MSSIEPDSARDAVTDWPTDDWEDTGQGHTPAPAATRTREVEVVPSRWAEHVDELSAAPTSPRRLLILGAVAGLALSGMLWWLIDGRGSDQPPVTITPASSSQQTPAPGAQPDIATDIPVPTTNTPVPTGNPATGTATEVARNFAADYANLGGGKDGWFNRISRWTSPQLTAGYRLTDPHRLPDATFQRLGPPLNNDSATVVYDAYYDTMTLEIRLAFLGDRWQVISALDAQPPDGDLSPPGSTPPVTTPYIPPDIGQTQP